MSIDEVFELTKIDRWFLQNLQQIVAEVQSLGSARVPCDWKSGFQPDSAGGLPDRRDESQGQAGSSSAKSAKMADVQFRAFDEHAAIEETRRHLPHWEQPGATYFVTFRLADSIANDVLAQWREERAQWLKHHPKPWDWKTAREYIRKFEEEREQWLNQGHGSCLLRERLDRSQQSRAHECRESRIRQVRIRMALAEAIDCPRKKQPCQRRHNHIAGPVGQVE